MTPDRERVEAAPQHSANAINRALRYVQVALGPYENDRVRDTIAILYDMQERMTELERENEHLRRIDNHWEDERVRLKRENEALRQRLKEAMQFVGSPRNNDDHN